MSFNVIVIIPNCFTFLNDNIFSFYFWNEIQFSVSVKIYRHILKLHIFPDIQHIIRKLTIHFHLYRQTDGQTDGEIVCYKRTYCHNKHIHLQYNETLHLYTVMSVYICITLNYKSRFVGFYDYDFHIMKITSCLEKS